MESLKGGTGMMEDSEGETLEEIKRVIFETALSPSELERLKWIQEKATWPDLDDRGGKIHG